MQTPARTLAILVAALLAAALVIYLGSLAGLDGLEPGVVVVPGVAALLSLVFVVGHRRG